MAAVALESVTKRFPGEVVAVDAFDLRVADGEFVVFVGPSGCGKTTTLRMIAGLEQPTSGTIRIGERVVNRVQPKDRDVAMVFQDYALYPHMTVRKNLAFGLKLRKVPKPQIAERVDRTATLLGIGELLDRKPRELSGGQQQRVALGRSIVREPACYLFDEPLSNLDAKLRMQMRAELKALHLRLGTTTIYVTHDQEEAMTLGERLVVMAGGVIQQIGAPLEVYREPVNRFVAGFLGSPSMNFIEGRLEKHDGGVRFTDGRDVRLPVGGELARRAADQVDRGIVAGVRPESLRFNGGEGRGVLPIEVRVTEPLGDRMDVYGTTDAGTEIVARVDPEVSCEAGDRITLSVDPAAVHLFEPGGFGRRV